MTGNTLGKPKPKVVGAVVHAVALLRVLAASAKPIGASVAARAAKVNTSTAFNILRTLTAERLVLFDEASKSYCLAPGLFELARGAGTDLAAIIKLELDRLSQQTGCLMVLWEVMGDRVVLTDRSIPDRPVGLHVVTRRMPLLLGAVGRCMAAALDLGDNEIKRAFAKLRWQGPISLREYVGDVRLARTRGFAVDEGCLYLGITSIAAAVTGQKGDPIYGISAIDMSSLLDEEKIASVGKELARLARALSAPTALSPAASSPALPAA